MCLSTLTHQIFYQIYLLDDISVAFWSEGSSNVDWLLFIPGLQFFSWDLSLPSSWGFFLPLSWVGALISCILSLPPYWFILIFRGASSNFFMKDSYEVHFVRFFPVFKWLHAYVIVCLDIELKVWKYFSSEIWRYFPLFSSFKCCCWVQCHYDFTSFVCDLFLSKSFTPSPGSL